MTIVLNSRDRDNAADNSNSWKITLNRPVFNVVKADLRYFFLANGMFNIDINPPSGGVGIAGNAFIMGGVQVIISAGYYTETDLCNTIGNQLTSILWPMIPNTPGDPLGVVIDPATNILTFNFKTTYTTPGSLVFPDATTSILFGFSGNLTNAYDPTTQTYLSSPDEVQISLDPYIYLQSSKLQNQVITSSGINAFAVVPMSSMPAAIASGESSLGASYDTLATSLDSSYFQNPQTLDMIDIRVVDSKGRLANTRNNNLTIILTVVCVV